MSLQGKGENLANRFPAQQTFHSLSMPLILAMLSSFFIKAFWFPVNLRIKNVAKLFTSLIVHPNVLYHYYWSVSGSCDLVRLIHWWVNVEKVFRETSARYLNMDTSEKSHHKSIKSFQPYFNLQVSSLAVFITSFYWLISLLHFLKGDGNTADGFGFDSLVKLHPLSTLTAVDANACRVPAHLRRRQRNTIGSSTSWLSFLWDPFKRIMSNDTQQIVGKFQVKL